MPCKTPLALSLDYNTIQGNRAKYVSCGKCSGCLKSRASSWMIRLMHELETTQYGGTFVTLTYADHMLPTDVYNNPVLVKRHLRNYFKRLRKQFNHKIKFYAIGEYGTNTFRPHYHFIGFNFNHNVNNHWKAIKEAWSSYDPVIQQKLPIGNVFVRDVNLDAIAYVTGYVIKPDLHRMADELGIQREFGTNSDGLGISHLTPQMIKYYRDNFVNYITMPNSSGKKRTLPRYYRQKLFNLKEPFKLKIQNNETTGYVHNLEEIQAYKNWKRQTYIEPSIEVNVSDIRESDRRFKKQQILKRQKL